MMTTRTTMPTIAEMRGGKQKRQDGVADGAVGVVAVTADPSDVRDADGVGEA